MNPEATDLNPEKQEQKVWDDCYSIAVFRLRKVRICSPLKNLLIVHS